MTWFIAVVCRCDVCGHLILQEEAWYKVGAPPRHEECLNWTKYQDRDE